MNLDKIPDKTLKLILQMMYEGLDEDDFDSDPFESSMISEVEDILSPLGVSFNDETKYSFFVQLYFQNPNFETEPIKRPTLSKYEIIHEEMVKEWKTYTYRSTMESYFPINSTMLHSLRGNGDGWYDYWDGQMIGNEIDDSEINEDDIRSIKKIG